ncbi:MULTISPECIES: PRTRC system protein C [Mucilaginibacter]|jgi:PRTRC genetic system protein C|uniref:PRTRC system protein C n=1 Tax=Mucilaginibacter psychrotolerans TaxID=1524096 RepID=A0A4Y8S7H1_9SPHI|nr:MULTISPECIES: PRTRC system protein C [Mucilaginibacter]QHS55924.1 PRTRC system protein C [Mucilaginibacter sp. 14171R-50]TFF34545.1 PRTRC system protein C [Mucilaginibacter psychrotolerans]
MYSELLPRVFIHKENGQEIRLTDPDSNLSPEEVCDSYSALYAILATAKIVGPEFKNDTAEYQFVTTLGTKG